MNEKLEKPHVVIVGAGFGGLSAIRALNESPVRLTVVDQHNYHLFQPLLYQVATAGVSADEIAYPVRAFLRRQKNASFHLAQVKMVDLKAKQLETDSGAIAYDYLILGIGGVTNFFGLKSVKENAFTMKDLDEAKEIRNHLLKVFERASYERDPQRRRSLLTFVVVGGGPTGVESAGALSELIRLPLAKDYPALDLAEVRILLLEASDRLLAAMPPDLSAFTLNALTRKKVEVRFGAAVESYDGRQAKLKGGETIPADTLIWAAGVQASPLAGVLGQPLGRQGRVRALPTLQLPEHPEVFVIGDAVYLEDSSGASLPMVAPVAMQQGERAAKNILRLMQGSAPEIFEYRDPGTLATIGRNQAVAAIGGFKFRGFPAWVVWLGAHILRIIGFRNRLIVLINWAWDYLFYDRAVRLIEPDCRKEVKSGIILPQEGKP
ncbi:MAG: NAD(P)/FAD-dependent oxidoreductase [Anaerolineaceae bacterium]|nr:NAD(P)/FAD-dependent oxidoreductase [Anaerolineaceae bacterium]